ncbi:MAG: RNA methyltransferase substrate-binding domain-containing protein [Subdoligranulum sp.]
MENKKRMPQQAPQAKADKAPAEQDTALVWGKNPVTELLKSEAGVDTLLLADSMEPRMAGYYTALGKAAGAVIKRVPAGKLQKLCGTQDHQGVAAWSPAYSMLAWRNFCRSQKTAANRRSSCCVTVLRTPTTWAQSCAARCCAVPTA